MSDTPIFDTFAAIYRYDGGWAFEDYGDAWRPWSDAWEKLCGAVVHQEDAEAFERSKQLLRAILKRHR